VAWCAAGGLAQAPHVSQSRIVLLKQNGCDRDSVATPGGQTGEDVPRRSLGGDESMESWSMETSVSHGEQTEARRVMWRRLRGGAWPLACECARDDPPSPLRPGEMCVFVCVPPVREARGCSLPSGARTGSPGSSGQGTRTGVKIFLPQAQHAGCGVTPVAGSRSPNPPLLPSSVELTTPDRLTLG
jgi:hypothetical protein